MADNRNQARFQQTETKLVSCHLRETKDTFITDIGRYSNLFPGAVDPGVYCMFLHTFTMSGNGFLKHDTVEGDRRRHCNGKLLLFHQQISVILSIQNFFRTFSTSQQIRAVCLANTFTGLFQRLNVCRREFTVTVRRYVQQEGRVTSNSPFVNIEHIIGTSHFLMCIITVEPAFTDRRISFCLLIMQVFCLI